MAQRDNCSTKTVYGPLGKAVIVMKDKFIVQISVISRDDPVVYANRTSVRHHDRVGHCPWWTRDGSDAARPCDCTAEDFARDYPVAPTTELEADFQPARPQDLEEIANLKAQLRQAKLDSDIKPQGWLSNLNPWKVSKPRRTKPVARKSIGVKISPKQRSFKSSGSHKDDDVHDDDVTFLSSRRLRSPATRIKQSRDIMESIETPEVRPRRGMSLPSHETGNLVCAKCRGVLTLRGEAINQPFSVPAISHSDDR